MSRGATRRAHLLRVERGPATFAELVAAARRAGLRVGWLDMSGAEPPPALERAAELGVVRAVAVGEGRTVTVKPRTGSAVLTDLLREHFLGCGVVLVRGESELPLLEPAGGDWTLRFPGTGERRYATDGLLARLRSPRRLVS